MTINENNFKKSSIEEAENYFKTIRIEKYQRRIVAAIAPLMCKYIPMSVMAMKGFSWRAISNWQVENKKGINELANDPPAVRMKAVLGIMENLEGELTRILLKQEDSFKIKQATAEAFEFYKTNFANR
jgi:hypothetical protein